MSMGETTNRLLGGFGLAGLTFLEYLQIGVAGELSPETL